MNDLSDRFFWMAREDEIKEGNVTDYYFINTELAFRKLGINPRVTMEIYTRRVPYPDEWGVVSGIYEAAKVLQGMPVDVWAMEEGEVFLTSKDSAAYEPVMRIHGGYAELARFETTILGFLCSSSGYATKAARIKLLAGDKVLLSFGTRRAHPSLAPLIERSAYMAGFDGVSNILGAKLIGIEGSGTMPHSFILCFKRQEDAWKAFDEGMPPNVPRIALTDTLYDEKTEAILALETLGERLYGVRLDTPSTRRGEWKKIIEEVRWELNIRGGKKVKIFVSGGIDEKDVIELKDVVDGFGVGTSVSDAPTIDFNMKVVEVEMEGKLIPKAKRGDLSGRKEAYRNWETFEDILLPEGVKPPAGYEPLLKPLIRKGRMVRKFKDLHEIREELVRKIDLLRRVKPHVRLGS